MSIWGVLALMPDQSHPVPPVAALGAFWTLLYAASALQEDSLQGDWDCLPQTSREAAQARLRQRVAPPRRSAVGTGQDDALAAALAADKAPGKEAPRRSRRLCATLVAVAPADRAEPSVALPGQARWAQQETR